MVSAQGIVMEYRSGSGGLVIANDSVIGKSLTLMPNGDFFLNYEDLKKLNKAVQSVITEHGVEELEVTVRPQLGTSRLVEARVASEMGSDFAVCIFRDITDRRDAEQLRVAKKPPSESVKQRASLSLT